MATEKVAIVTAGGVGAMSAALTKALELGATVVVASSGNAGAGATYSAPGVGGADAGVILGRYSR